MLLNAEKGQTRAKQSLGKKTVRNDSHIVGAISNSAENAGTCNGGPSNADVLHSGVVFLSRRVISLGFF